MELDRHARRRVPTDAILEAIPEQVPGRVLDTFEVDLDLVADGRTLESIEAELGVGPRPAAGEAAEGELSEEMRQSLEALGYL